MKYCHFLLALFMSVCSCSVLSEPIKQQDHDDLMQVVEDFRLALINKDEKSFIDLFYTKTAPWIGIVNAQDKGDLPSNNGEQLGNHLSFIGWIARTPAKIEEKFWDINIQTDGIVASIYFKYSFHNDDYKSNWGSEAWQLVKTKGSWKITALVYSITENPEPAKAKDQ
jgi:hypothetical protein